MYVCLRFEGKLMSIVEHFHTVMLSISSRIRAEQFKVRRCVHNYACTLRNIIPLASTCNGHVDVHAVTKDQPNFVG